MGREVSRRRALAGGAGVFGGALLGTRGAAAQPTPVVASAPAAREWTAAHTQNGWPVVPEVAPIWVQGSGLAVPVLAGDVAAVLLHCVRRYCYRAGGRWHDGDLRGHTTDRVVDAEYESNHLSGTAIAIRPSCYPLGIGGGLFGHELAVIRDVLAECEGVVRWGGDLRPVKESHFQIDVPPGDPRLGAVAEKLRGLRVG